MKKNDFEFLSLRQLLTFQKIPVEVFEHGAYWFVRRYGQKCGYFLSAEKTKKAALNYCKRNNLEVV